MSLQRMNFIGGQHRESYSNKGIELRYQINSRLVCTVPDLNKIDVERTDQLTELCEAGMIGVNFSIPFPIAWHCFGGWKQ